MRRFVRSRSGVTVLLVALFLVNRAMDVVEARSERLEHVSWTRATEVEPQVVRLTFEQPRCQTEGTVRQRYRADVIEITLRIVKVDGRCEKIVADTTLSLEEPVDGRRIVDPEND